MQVSKYIYSSLRLFIYNKFYPFSNTGLTMSLRQGHKIVKEISITFVCILIFFIVLVASFIFCSLKSLVKNGQYYYFITKLAAYIFILDKIIAIKFNSKKNRYLSLIRAWIQILKYKQYRKILITYACISEKKKLITWTFEILIVHLQSNLVALTLSSGI